MSLKRRIAALERCYAVGTDGRCVACPPISFSVAWGDDPSAEARPLERCRSCGRARERFILCINTPHQAPAREEKEPSGTRADAVNGPVAAPGGPEGRGRSRDDAAPGLATTAPPRDTTDVARSAAAEALSRDAPAEVSSAARQSPTVPSQSLWPANPRGAARRGRSTWRRARSRSAASASGRASHSRFRISARSATTAQRWGSPMRTGAPFTNSRTSRSAS